MLHYLEDAVEEAGWGGHGSGDYITDILADKSADFIKRN